MSKVKIVCVEGDGCEGCIYYKNDDCYASNKEANDCIDRFVAGNDTIYVLDGELK